MKKEKALQSGLEKVELCEVEGRKTFKVGDFGLTRTELRLLERRGYLERLRTVKRKWSDVTPTEQFVYRRPPYAQRSQDPD